MALGTIDCTTLYFKYETPIPIRGEPTHKSIKGSLFYKIGSWVKTDYVSCIFQLYEIHKYTINSLFIEGMI